MQVIRAVCVLVCLQRISLQPYIFRTLSNREAILRKKICTSKLRLKRLQSVDLKTYLSASAASAINCLIPHRLYSHVDRVILTVVNKGDGFALSLDAIHCNSHRADLLAISNESL